LPLGRIEQGRIEQGRIEQGRIEQGRIEQGRIEQGRVIVPRSRPFGSVRLPQHAQAFPRGGGGQTGMPAAGLASAI
jgi:hypothetical protein